MMKKLTAAVMVLCLLCLTLTGCKKEAEKPTDSPAKTQESQSAKPSESPKPIADTGELELDEYYYEDGDIDGMYLYFYDDGTVEIGDPYDDTIVADYKIRGNEITLTYEGETETLFIVDAYNLADEWGDIVFIREGGEVFTGELPDIFFTEFYYLDGDSGNVSLFFWDDGDVDIDSPDDSVSGTYTYDGYVITVYVDGVAEIELEVFDICTLIDSNGDVYYLEDSQEMILETLEYYYIEGDESAGSLYFWDDGDVDMENSDGEEVTATYTVSGTTVTITYDGEDLDLEIVNAYILESDEGMLFIRVP